jgi:F-type H+-transporting ATPase subunit b
MQPLHTLLAAPVVDIDGTFFVQGGLFLMLVFVLKPLLFTPWLEAQARRKEAVEGSLVRATQLEADAESLVAKYDARLDAARDKANGVRATARREEDAAKAERLATARDVAQRELDEERARIESESTKAREELGGRVEDLASDIAHKLLGRAS